MADSGDFTDLFAYINKRNTAIHGSPSNEYEQYLNVYCFVHSSIKRKDAVSVSCHGLVNIFHSGMYSLGGGEGGCSKEYVLYARENVENYGPPLSVFNNI